MHACRRRCTRRAHTDKRRLNPIRSTVLCPSVEFAFRNIWHPSKKESPANASTHSPVVQREVTRTKSDIVPYCTSILEMTYIFPIGRLRKIPLLVHLFVLSTLCPVLEALIRFVLCSTLRINSGGAACSGNLFALH